MVPPQVRIVVAAIQNGVVRFGRTDRAEYCAVLEVAGSQESLARVDDAKQEELLDAYCQFLNSITFAFQLVVQVHPVDLAWYVTRVEERARALSPALVAIARDDAWHIALTWLRSASLDGHFRLADELLLPISLLVGEP